MAHVRAQIRDAIATALSGVGPAVHKSRTYGINTRPAIAVYVGSETSDQPTMGNGATVRLAQVFIEAITEGAVDALDDALDGYATAIEIALSGNLLGGLLKDMYISSTETAIDDSGEIPQGMVRMTFPATYVTLAGAPETAN